MEIIKYYSFWSLNWIRSSYSY